MNLQAPFRPRRLGHANLFVSSYERASDYYRRVAGLEEVYRQPDVKASFVSNGNTYHDLGLTDVKAPYAAKGQGPGLYHYAFELVNEVELVKGYRRALEAGVKFVATKDHDVAHSLYLKDPDGLYLELYADVVKDWRKRRTGVLSGKKPQWIPGETTPPVADHNYAVDPEIKTIKDALFHPKRATHVGVVARDYPAMFDFYTRVIGLTPLVGDAKSAWSVLRGTDGGGLSLFRARPDLKPGFHHVGLEVWSESDLSHAVAELPRDGFKLERAVDHPARLSASVLDPDGIRLQFHVDRDWSAETIQSVDEETAPYIL